MPPAASAVGSGCANSCQNTAADKPDQQHHREGVELADARLAKGDPGTDPQAQQDNPAGRGIELPVLLGQVVELVRAGAQHDHRPADQLDHIEQGEQLAAIASEGCFGRTHGRLLLAGADDPAQHQQRGANHMAKDDGDDTPGQTQWCQQGPRQDFRQRYGSAEPEKEEGQFAQQGHGLDLDHGWKG